MLISVHERRPRLRWVERPIKVLEKMPARRRGPDWSMPILSLVLSVTMVVILALLARGGR